MAVNNEETLGQIIKSKRLRLGLSLRDLAKQTGLSHSSILRIEENQFKMVDTDTLGAIADALHLDRLYGGERRRVCERTGTGRPEGEFP